VEGVEVGMMQMKPTIYPPMPGGTLAQQYLHRARMFHAAATDPPLSDYRNGEPFWPKYALLTHAIELSLKAFHHYSVEKGKSPPAKEPKQHDLVRWYLLAVDYGLPKELTMIEYCAILNELHLGHLTRYPQAREKPIPNASIIAEEAVDHLISTLTPIINPR
jgi:hypothetical protein